VDVLINNAGLGGTKALVDMSDEEWNRVMDITLNGTMRMLRVGNSCADEGAAENAPAKAAVNAIPSEMERDMMSPRNLVLCNSGPAVSPAGPEKSNNRH
jgi:hypothetical protein